MSARHFIGGLILWWSGCDLTGVPPSPSPLGGMGVELNQCGSLETEMSPYLLPPQSSLALSLELGYDRPFRAAEQFGIEGDFIELPIEYGLQGGHHVDLSLRLVGALDPDLVDLEITLSVVGPLSDRYRGSHDTQEWYLLFPSDNEPQGCYFHRARIFLFNEEDAPLQTQGVRELNHELAILNIRLVTQGSTYQWQVRGRFRDATDNL